MVRITRAGSAGNYITFKSENPLGAKLNGQSNTIGEGWYLEAGYIRIEGFEIYGVGQHGVVSWASHVQIVGNDFHDIGRRCTNTAVGIVGISAAPSSDYTIEKNSFHDSGRYNASEFGCALLTYQQQDHGIYLQSVDTVTIKNNLFYNLFRGYSIQVYNGTGGAAVSSNVKILNNVMVGTASVAVGHIILASPGLTNGTIENNISYSPHGGYMIDYYLPALSNVVARNNLIYQGTKSSPSPPAGITFSGNIDNTDPLFVNVGAFDFHLQAGSPALNVGLTEAAVTDDYAGVSRPQGSAYDIGAYEYISNAPVNLALNKSAVASSLEDAAYPAAQAFDGNATTRWSSAFSDPQWIYVDLGANYTVTGVKLVWEAAYASAFQIQASTDAAAWADLYSTTTGTGGTQTLTLTPTTARYIRMYGTVRATAYGYSLFEMEVYGDETPSAPGPRMMTFGGFTCKGAVTLK